MSQVVVRDGVEGRCQKKVFKRMLKEGAERAFGKPEEAVKLDRLSKEGVERSKEASAAR